MPHGQRNSTDISLDFSPTGKPHTLYFQFCLKRYDFWILCFLLKVFDIYFINHLSKKEFGEIVFFYCSYCARHNISLGQPKIVLVYFSNSHIISLVYVMVVIRSKSQNFAICTVAKPTHSHAADFLSLNRTQNLSLLTLISFFCPDVSVSWHHLYSWACPLEL